MNSVVTPTCQANGVKQTEVNADHSRLKRLSFDGQNFPCDEILALLKQDYVVLLSDVSAVNADALMAQFSDKIGLKDSLELQAAFAPSLGGRRNIGQYFMSVEQRGQYHIVPPHCEGSTFASIQLASFYCYENTTDGGETLLFNIKQTSDAWSKLKEQLTRAKYDGTPTAADISQARIMYRLNLIEDSLKSDDQVLQQQQMNEKLALYAVLAHPVTCYSKIAERQLYCLWDSITGPDHDAIDFMAQLLSAKGILKTPAGFVDLSQGIGQIDWSPARRVMRSGADYGALFSGHICHKLAPNELMIYNNISWAHSVNNWTPDSGVRNVAAAFA